MAKVTTPQVVRSYLAELESALGEVRPEARDEILAGVREELRGLDAAAAARRIEELGDPQFIAAEAREEAGVPTPVVVAEPEPRWYPVLAALLVMFGGILIPVIGWIAGLAMMWFSRTWTRGEKWTATLTPFAAVAALALLTLTLTWSAEPRTPSDSGDFHAPSMEDFPQPLLPTSYDLLWSAVPLVVLLNVVVGIWLLWRAKRRWAEPANR